jgi:hypothetical protein
MGWTVAMGSGAPAGGAGQGCGDGVVTIGVGLAHPAKAIANMINSVNIRRLIDWECINIDIPPTFR